MLKIYILHEAESKVNILEFKSFSMLYFVTCIKQSHNVRYSVYMAVKIQVEFYWAVMPLRLVVRYLGFRVPCCLPIQGNMTVCPEKVNLNSHMVYFCQIFAKL
jgi:hypothetical protein